MDINPLTQTDEVQNQNLVNDQVVADSGLAMPPPPPLSQAAPPALVSDAPIIDPPAAAVPPAPAIPNEHTLDELEKAVSKVEDQTAETMTEVTPVDVPPVEPTPSGDTVADILSDGSTDTADEVIPAPPSTDDILPPAEDSTLVVPEDASASSNTFDEVAGDGSDLDDIKSAALKELAPIVEKLDQPPEEKFNTMVMLIQSSDDENLIRPAFDAAKGIEDESKRAQALLDIVNEVNYLEQKD